MPLQNRTRLMLELDVGADPVAGTAFDATGARERFVGWIALARAVELALERASSSGPQTPGHQAARRTTTTAEPR